MLIVVISFPAVYRTYVSKTPIIKPYRPLSDDRPRLVNTFMPKHGSAHHVWHGRN